MKPGRKIILPLLLVQALHSSPISITNPTHGDCTNLGSGESFLMKMMHQ